MTTCELCSRSDRPSGSMCRGEELFSGGHEAAGFASCAECGRLFAELFLEVYDDLWTYFIPLLAGEGDALRQQFKDDVQGAFASLNELAESRKRLESGANSQQLSWGEGPTVFGLPPW